MFKLLLKKNFLFLFAGRFITNLGDSIYIVAAMWLVYDLTKNPLYTGIASAVMTGPRIFEFLVGPFVDRWNVKSIMVYSQIMEGLFILVIPLASYLHFLNVWIVIAVMFLVVSVERFVFPAQSAVVPRILEKEELASGNALMTLAYQGSDFILTGLSGVILMHVGAISVYLMDTWTFLIAALLFMKIRIHQAKASAPPKSTIYAGYLSYKKELAEGLTVVKNSFIPRFMIPIVIANFIFGMINGILPAYANMKGGEPFYGYYLVSISIGLLIGVLVASKMKHWPLGKLIISAFFLSSLMWGLSDLVNPPFLSVGLLGLSMVALGLANVLINSIFQALVPERLLGRVFSVVNSMAAASLPIGALVGGYLAHLFGSEWVFLAGSLAHLFTALYWLLAPSMRKLPSYLKMGASDRFKLNFPQNGEQDSTPI
ncbi:MFS transporter [Caenibacillus caldisaponilyticus]|uniref:MFS transporter n=1 Tax=Caenibacillus caldisaponilyticus TaxID=1674942 RepID=UPI000988859D|nr:MFS transporter [Caenibacillus caldisaponilyticus]